MYIKYDANGNVEEILINEAKQIGSAGNIKLNGADLQSGLDPQMSDGWIKSRLTEMKTQGGELSALATTIENNFNKITKTVTGVDKSTKEIIVLKLESY